MHSDESLIQWAQWGVLDSARYRLVLDTFGSLAQAWARITPDFFIQTGMGSQKAEGLFHIRQRLDSHILFAKMQRLGIRALGLDDPEYPHPLKQIADPPPFLFVRGPLPSFHKALAVVGTRAMSDYGQSVTRRLTAELARSGFAIVSGLALGVDACAHQATIEAGGVTLGVLGCGVDQVYPASNHALAQSILASGGALLSSYPLGSPALRHHFPQRNAVVSGLCRGVLVTEGGIKSGALITARLALEQGREVFAIPSPAYRPFDSGTNHLIRRGEAKLVESAAHVLEEFDLSPAESSAPAVEPEEKALLEQLAQGPKSADQLMQDLGLSISALSSRLMGLSLKGLAREGTTGWQLE